MKGMVLKKCDIYYSKWATVAKKFQLSMTKLGTHDKIRWNDGSFREIFGNGRHKQRSGQHTLARQKKIYKDIFSELDADLLTLF